MGDEYEPEEHLIDQEQRLIEAIIKSPALAKSCVDSFDYAMRLRTGEVIRYSEAKLIGAEWIHITPMDEQPKTNRLAFKAARGMDIRISDIVWVMDAPEGS